MTEKLTTQRNLREELTLSATGFLFDHVSGLTYTVNATGRFILQNLLEGHSAAEILKKLTGEFEVSEATARKDVEEFFEQMRAFGVL